MMRTSLPALRSAVPLTFVLTAALATTARAQERPAIPSVHSDVYTTMLTAETLADLPLGQTIYSALETTQPELISDRFNSGGLNVGENARLGGFLGSPSQTVFRIGDVDISDPSGSGAPLLFPEQLFWQGAAVWKALMPIDLSTPGLGVTLDPRRPAAKWTTTIEAAGTGGSLVGAAPEDQPSPVMRLSNWGHGSALFSGPISGSRLGLVAGGAWTQSERFSRTPLPAADSMLGSGFVNLVYTPSAQTDWQTLAWIQRARAPFVFHDLFGDESRTTDNSVHVQSEWKRRTNERSLALYGAVTRRSRVSDLNASTLFDTERLVDGPVPVLAAAMENTTVSRVQGGARSGATAGDGRHQLTAGLNGDYSWMTTPSGFQALFGESVDGTQARLWSISNPGNSKRHAATFALFADDHMTLRPDLTFDAAVRLEVVSGSAAGAAQGITWVTVLPRVAVHWEFAQEKKIALVGGYRRAANRLNLDVLAYGDPNGTTGLVSRSTILALPGPGQPFAPIIDRIGPGTGGNAAFSRVDEDLKRPVTDEWLIGVETTGTGWLRLGLTGIARRESNVLGVVDQGVPISAYTTVGVSDPGLDFFDPADDQIVPVYNRVPASYGQNQYLLTNPDQLAPYTGALELSAQSAIDRLFMQFGATAYAALGSSGNRGFRAFENDQDMLGELYTNPNATTFARGRLFTDRAFTIKWTTVYRFPGDFHAGLIARYQDGQPFSRLIVVRELNQGPEAVHAYPNGDNRFTFTGTLDIRLQKGFRIGSGRVDAIADFYNLATRSNEVEEYVVTGPLFRTPTLIEPPHTIHFGLRLTF
jgi:hypothetical protein